MFELTGNQYYGLPGGPVGSKVGSCSWSVCKRQAKGVICLPKRCGRCVAGAARNRFAPVQQGIEREACSPYAILAKIEPVERDIDRGVKQQPKAHPLGPA